MVPVSGTIRVFFVGQLGKYVPGAVWPIVAQMELGKAYGLSKRPVGTVALLCMVLNVATGVLVAVVLLPFASPSALHHYGWVIAVLPIGLVLLHPKILNPVINKVFTLAHREPLEQPLTMRGIVTATGWTLLMWAAYGVQIWVLAAGLHASGAASLQALSVGAFALAWTAGFLFVITPAGAGVREAVLILALTAVLHHKELVALAAVSRLLMTVGDLAWGSIGGLIRVKRSRHCCSRPAPGDARSRLGLVFVPHVRSAFSRTTAMAAVTALAGAAVVLAPTTASANSSLNESYLVPASRILTIDGHGWGHGEGMSQEGAKRAAQLGVPATGILGFYYPGAKIDGAGNPNIRVALTGVADGPTAKGYQPPSASRYQCSDKTVLATYCTLSVVQRAGIVVTDSATGKHPDKTTGVDEWGVLTAKDGLHLRMHTKAGWADATIAGKKALGGPITFTGPSLIRVDWGGDVFRDYRTKVSAVRTFAGTATVPSRMMRAGDDELGRLHPRRGLRGVAGVLAAAGARGSGRRGPLLR